MSQRLGGSRRAYAQDLVDDELGLERQRRHVRRSADENRDLVREARRANGGLGALCDRCIRFDGKHVRRAGVCGHERQQREPTRPDVEAHAAGSERADGCLVGAGALRVVCQHLIVPRAGRTR